MSIDLSKVVGWSDPVRGNVVQITDASGRVIWSANKTVNVVYLRPSADISVGHSLNPADSTSAYMLVNEEVDDNTATYIYTTLPSGDGIESGTSKFELPYDKVLKANSITSGRIVATFMTSYVNQLVRRTDLIINGVEYNCPIVGEVDGSLGACEFDITDCLAIINANLTSEGKLPSLSICVGASGYCSSSKNDGYIRIGQVYLELNGEFVV